MKLKFALGLLALAFTGTSWAAGDFYLHNGDRVLFYGDSITEQRYYPVAVETYVRTRFPNLKVSFIDSAVGGARVTGNWAVRSEQQSLARTRRISVQADGCHHHARHERRVISAAHSNHLRCLPNRVRRHHPVPTGAPSRSQDCADRALALG
jgi:hypothetical protein